MASNEDDAAQASVQLSVGAFPPQLTQTFARQVIHPGSSVSLKCIASGTPLPHFTWTLDGSPLPVSPDIQRYFLGQQQDDQQMAVTHLNISHVRVEDGGHYKVLRVFAGQNYGPSLPISIFQCVAENRVGRAEHSAAIHVYGPPHVRPMGGVVAVGGKRLEMTCPVAGYPIESVVWEKDGRRLNGRQKVQLLNSSLAIDPVDKASDAGVYSCEARQHDGLSACQSFQLYVIGKSVSPICFARQMSTEIAEQTRRI